MVQEQHKGSFPLVETIGEKSCCTFVFSIYSHGFQLISSKTTSRDLVAILFVILMFQSYGTREVLPNKQE